MGRKGVIELMDKGAEAEVILMKTGMHLAL
jgi:hypothetical protein